MEETDTFKNKSPTVDGQDPGWGSCWAAKWGVSYGRERSHQREETMAQQVGLSPESGAKSQSWGGLACPGACP